jgi:hypothetical protein
MMLMEDAQYFSLDHELESMIADKDELGKNSRLQSLLFCERLCGLQESIPEQSTEHIPASIVPPSEERCDTIPPLANTHMHKPTEPTQKTT